MTTHHKRPQRAADSRPRNRVTQERRRRRTIMHLARLRVQARDEIARLIDFLDATDDYAQSEREPDLGFPEPVLTGEESAWWFVYRSNDACQYQTQPQATRDLELDGCDDEHTEDDEPSLGSTIWRQHESQEAWGRSDASDREEVCEDEGAQCEDEGACREDDEPSLGWTLNGCLGDLREPDREEGGYAARPQNRTVIDRPPVTVEATYRKFVHGVPENIKDAMRDRVSSPEVFLR